MDNRGSIASKFSHAGAREGAKSVKLQKVTELENESRHQDSYNLYQMTQNVMSKGGMYEKIETEVDDSAYDRGNKP